MRCLYCGKKLGLLKRAHGDEFCSPQHHDSYTQQAENALNRLRDSPENLKASEAPAVAQAPPVAVAPVVAAAAPVSKKTTPPLLEPPAPPLPPPPHAPLLRQAYPAQIPPETPKLIPGGPEQIRLTPPTPPKMNLVVAAEIPAPPPIPPMGSSVLALKVISVSARAIGADPLEFMIELARPRLAVPPVTEELAPPSAPAPHAAPPATLPEELREPEIKAPAAEQKPIFDGGFESPWTLTATPPQACDLAVPPQLRPIRLRLMDSGQPQHHPLPLDTSDLTVDTCYSDAPVPRMRAGVLPPARPTELLRRPGPPAARDEATVQIRHEAERIFEPAESVQPAAAAVDFVISANMDLDLPHVFSADTALVVPRPDEVIPIEKVAAGAGLLEKEAGVSPTGARPIAVSPNEPSPCGFGAVALEELCPAIEPQREGVLAEFKALGAEPPVQSAASLKEIRLPRKVSIYRKAGLRLRRLETLEASPVDRDRTPASLAAVAMDPRVAQVASQPVGFDPVSTIAWQGELAPDRIATSIAQGHSGPAAFPPVVMLPRAACRLIGPGLLDHRFLLMRTTAEVNRSSVNLLTSRPMAVAEIPVPGITRLPSFPRGFELPILEVSAVESIECAELIQLPSDSAGHLSGSPALDPVPPQELPENGKAAHTAALQNQFPSLEWISSPADLPKYQPFVKFLPARRTLEFTRPV